MGSLTSRGGPAPARRGLWSFSERNKLNKKKSTYMKLYMVAYDSRKYVNNNLQFVYPLDEISYSH